MSQTLIETVKQAQRGDQHALGVLYDRFAPLVRTVCFDQIGDYESAWDTFQDVFLTMVKDLRRLERPERFRSWLTGIARRKAIDYVRRKMRLRWRAQVLDEEPAGPTPDPAQQEILKQLRRAVSDLLEQERLAVQLFHLEGLAVTEITNIMNLPRSTIYATLIRARARLKARLEKVDRSEVPS